MGMDSVRPIRVAWSVVCDRGQEPHRGGLHCGHLRTAGVQTAGSRRGAVPRYAFRPHPRLHTCRRTLRRCDCPGPPAACLQAGMVERAPDTLGRTPRGLAKPNRIAPSEDRMKTDRTDTPLLATRMRGLEPPRGSQTSGGVRTGVV